MIKQKHPKLVELVCKICQTADSQCEILDTWKQPMLSGRLQKEKENQGRLWFWPAPRRHCETRAKVMSFPEFQTSINKVDATRTVSSSEAARVR
jgi:hypothetical protein